MTDAYTPERVRTMAALTERLGRSFNSAELAAVSDYLKRCAEIANQDGDLSQQLEAERSRVAAQRLELERIDTLSKELVTVRDQLVYVREELQRSVRHRMHFEQELDESRREVASLSIQLREAEQEAAAAKESADASASLLIAASARAEAAESDLAGVRSELTQNGKDSLAAVDLAIKSKTLAELLGQRSKQIAAKLLLTERELEEARAKLAEQRLWYWMAVQFYEEVLAFLPRDKQTLIAPMRAAPMAQSDRERLAKAIALLRKAKRWASLYAQSIGDTEAEAFAAETNAFLEAPR